MPAGEVHLHAHGVDATHDYVVEGTAEGGLVHIVLVLAHADGLGVDLYQLGEGVLEAPADGDGTAHGHVVVGELLAGGVGGGVDGGPALVHHDDDHGRRQIQGAQEGLGLTAGGAVAHGDGLEVMFAYQLNNAFTGGRPQPFRLVGEDGVVLQQVPLGIEGGQLAAGAEARVHGQDGLLSQRGRQQQLAHVGGEDADGLFVGATF